MRVGAQQGPVSPRRQDLTAGSDVGNAGNDPVLVELHQELERTGGDVEQVDLLGRDDAEDLLGIESLGRQADDTTDPQCEPDVLLRHVESRR